MLSRMDWFAAKTAGAPWHDRWLGLLSDLAHAYGGPWLAAAMVAAGLAGLVMLATSGRADRGGVRTPMALVLLAMVAVNALFVLPVEPHAFEPRPRYVIVMQISLWLGAALLVAHLRGRAMRLAAMLMLAAAMALLSLRSLDQGELDRYRLGQVIQAIKPRVDVGDNVIYYPAWIDASGVYYGLRPTHTPPTMEFGSDYTALPWSVSRVDQPTWLIIAYHRETGATDAAPDIVQHLADRYRVAVDRRAITAAVRDQAVVVVRIGPRAVQIEPDGLNPGSRQ